MKSDHRAVAISQNQKIAAGQLPYVLGSVLNRGRVMGRHDSACDRKVSQQFRGTRQHDFAVVLKVLERGDGVPQVLNNAIAHMTLHAVAYHEKAHRREPRRNDQHREQKARAQPRSVYKRGLRPGWESSRSGF